MRGGAPVPAGCRRGVLAAQGFDCRRVDTIWRFRDRGELEDTLRIEFPPKVAARAIAQTSGLTIPVRYRLHLRREPTDLSVGHWKAR